MLGRCPNFTKNARMGIVSIETAVLRRWEIDKQELGLSTEALLI